MSTQPKTTNTPPPDGMTQEEWDRLTEGTVTGDAARDELERRLKEAAK